MNPNGSWQGDAQDQAEQFNANRGDNWLQWSQNRADRLGQNAWQRDVALAQIGLGRDEMNLGHQDRAAALQAQMDAAKQQFGYMANRDTMGDKRWQQQFDLSRADQEDNLNWRQYQRTRQEKQDELQDPMLKTQAALQQMQLDEMQKRAATAAGVGGIAYAPSTDQGKDAYQFALRSTGDPLQAGMASKQTDRQQQLADAEAAASGVGGDVAAYSARDTKMFGWDPTEEDTAALTKKIEGLTQLYRSAGLSEPQVQAKIRDVLTKNQGNSKDLNAGNIQALLRRYGIQQ